MSEGECIEACVEARNPKDIGVLPTMNRYENISPERAPKGAFAAQFVILAAAGAGVLLYGGMTQGGLGVFLLTAAVFLVFVQPSVRPVGAAWLVAGFIVGGASLSLLPSGIVRTQAWREVLIAEGGFGALNRVTIVPEETMFWVAILASSLVIGIYLLSQPVSSTGMVWLAAAASLFCAAYAGMAMFAKATGWHPAFQHELATFGFFWNRNHVSTFLVTGALAGIGALAGGIERRNISAALAGAAGVGACSWAVLLESPSRGGVLILVLGAGLWLFGIGRVKWTRPVLVTSGTLLVAALLFCLGTDNPVSRRLFNQGQKASEDKVTADGRLRIYKDSLRMMADFPLTGSGLGTYRFLYPFYADASLTESTAIHPESDWLMTEIEAGPIAVAGFLLLVIFGVRRAYSLRRDSGWTVRWALVCSAAAAMVHGIMDVPLHLGVLGWWVMVLGCLGLGDRPGESAMEKCGTWQRWAFVIPGLFVGLLGWRLVSAQWFGGDALPPFAPQVASKKILAKYNAEDREGAFYLAEAECVRWPMDGELRYQLGVLGLLFEETEAEADAAFRAARILNPNWPRTPFDQANAWYPFDKKRAAGLWLEAVERQAKIDRRQKSSNQPGMRIYSAVLSKLYADPEALQLVAPPVGSDPSLHLAWIGAAADVGPQIRMLASDASFCGNLNHRQRAEFFALWESKGDAVTLEEFLRTNPGWEDDAWGARARALVAAGDYAGAVGILQKHFSVKLELPKSTGGSDHGLEAEYAALASARNDVAARRILDEAGRAGGERSATAHRLRAELAAQNGDWELAYKELIDYLRASGQNPAPIL